MPQQKKKSKKRVAVIASLSKYFISPMPFFVKKLLSRLSPLIWTEAGPQVCLLKGGTKILDSIAITNQL